MPRPDRGPYEARQPEMAHEPRHNRDEFLCLLAETILAISPPVITGTDRARLIVLQLRMEDGDRSAGGRNLQAQYDALEAREVASPVREPIDAILTEFPPARPFVRPVQDGKIAVMRNLLAAGQTALGPLHGELERRVDEAEAELDRPN